MKKTELEKKIDKLISELADLSKMYIRLKEENKELKKMIKEKDKQIEILLAQKEEAKDKITRLILKIGEFEDLIIRKKYEG